MSHQLSRRDVSAIAKLELAALTLTQRIDAIAKVLGYATGAAMMGTLKSLEKTAASEALPQAQFRAVTVFGSGAGGTIDASMSIRDEYDNHECDIVKRSFTTNAELEAYIRGMEDANGWHDYSVIVHEGEDPDHPFLLAAATSPDLTFIDWYEAQLCNTDDPDNPDTN